MDLFFKRDIARCYAGRYSLARGCKSADVIRAVLERDRRNPKIWDAIGRYGTLETADLLGGLGMQSKQALDRMVRSACEHGRADILSFWISKQKTSLSSTMMYFACLCGDLDTVEQLLARLPQSRARVTYKQVIINEGFKGACRGGHLNIARRMIECGAGSWDAAFGYACVYGDVELVKLIIERGAPDLKYGLACACNRNNHEVARYLISLGAGPCPLCSNANHYTS